MEYSFWSVGGAGGDGAPGLNGSNGGDGAPGADGQPGSPGGPTPSVPDFAFPDSVLAFDSVAVEAIFDGLLESFHRVEPFQPPSVLGADFWTL